MRKFIVLASIIASTSAFAQAGYDQQSEMFFQNQRDFHNRQVQNAIEQQRQDQQMQDLRSIYNSPPAYRQPYYR